MLRTVSCAIAPTVCLLFACKAAPELAAEPAAPAPAPAPTLHAAAPVEAPPSGAAHGAPDPRLPIVGDPLGLLSRPAARVENAPARPSVKSSFDPGALMASAKLAPATTVPPERDERALARSSQAEDETRKRPTTRSPRGPIAVQEKSASEVIGAIRRSTARPHVLFLYASYCRACRNVLPSFLPLVEYYRQRGVQFTAASIDRDISAYEGYAPVLNGVLPPVLIRSEGETRSELVRAGLKFSGDSFSIPLVAVFDKGHRLVQQGGSGELAKLPQTLDGLLQ